MQPNFPSQKTQLSNNSRNNNNNNNRTRVSPIKARQSNQNSQNWSTLIPPIPNPNNRNIHNNNHNNNNQITNNNNEFINNDSNRFNNNSINNEDFYTQRASSVPDVSHLGIQENTTINNTSQLIKHDSEVPTTVKKAPKICFECGKPITCTLVRAMGRIYHIECFRCYDCGKECSDKFFTIDISINDSLKQEVPLCEYDYFKRIDLICGYCNKAIRAPYISAINKKFHPEHFFCEICHKSFEDEDYYESNNSIFCHYHFSKLHAYHCEACNSAILKQYVQICRGGKEQQWHPECFMIHKFWGVSIGINCIGLINNQFFNSINDSTVNPKDLFDIEKKLERITMSIWLTLSEFEESCANCISEMLHFASTGNHLNGLLNTGKLILKIECLFKGIDFLNDFSKNVKFDIFENNQKISSLLKEPRSMSSKIMSYLTFLRDVDKLKLNSSKYSQELLLLISNLAHYLKLISRDALFHAVELNKLTKSTTATDRLLREILKHDSVPNDIFPILNIASNSKDLCYQCNSNIEEECIQFEDKRWHPNCLKCSNCSKLLTYNNSLDDSTFNSITNVVLCDSCSTNDVDSKTGFKRVSRFMQLIYLLKIALIRSRHSMKKKGQLESNNTSYVSSSITELDDYAKNVSNITRMRSLRENQTINNISTTQNVRKSLILQDSVPSAAETEKLTPSTKKSITSLRKELTSSKKSSSRKLRLIDDLPINGNGHLHKGNNSSQTPSPNPSTHSYDNVINRNNQSITNQRSQSTFSNNQNNNLFITSNLLKNEKSLTLDDIPRIVSSEQAREHRPNAFKFQKRIPTTSSTLPVAKAINPNKNPELLSDRNISSSSSSNPPPVPPNPRFSPQLDKSQPSFNQKSTQTQSDQLGKQSHATPLGSNRQISQQSQQSSSSHRRHDVNLLDVDTATNNNNGKAVNSSISSLSMSDQKANGTSFVRFSELNSTQHLIIRHISAFALNKILKNTISMEDCLLFIEVRKSAGFWERLFNNNSNNNNHNANSKDSANKVFGTPLDSLVKKYGIDSDLGVGAEKLRIPIFVDDVINVMRQMDLSVEGIFRINGNIRRLKQLVEEIDNSPTNMPDLSKEMPVQVAALLKKFTREMPNPLLTFSLYDLFITSQKALTEDNDEKMKMCILRLAYSMLPKSHRDLTEVLLNFFAWVATFAHIDNEIGSKMDTHNLATVLTPNILHAKPPQSTTSSSNGNNNSGGYPSVIDTKSENHFLAIEVVNTLIEEHEDLAIVPKELVEFYKLAGFGELGSSEQGDNIINTNSSANAIAKEIINKCQAAFNNNSDVFNGLLSYA